jgi:hypothetical protein
MLYFYPYLIFVYLTLGALVMAIALGFFFRNKWWMVAAVIPAHVVTAYLWSNYQIEKMIMAPPATKSTLKNIEPATRKIPFEWLYESIWVSAIVIAISFTLAYLLKKKFSK